MRRGVRIVDHKVHVNMSSRLTNRLPGLVFALIFEGSEFDVAIGLTFTLGGASVLLLIGLVFILGGGSLFSIASCSMSLGDVSGKLCRCNGEILLVVIESTWSLNVEHCFSIVC